MLCPETSTYILIRKTEVYNGHKNKKLKKKKRETGVVYQDRNIIGETMAKCSAKSALERRRGGVLKSGVFFFPESAL
jgi:ABC-type phosphate/phosphonate transport system ATPase subunit